MNVQDIVGMNKPPTQMQTPGGVRPQPQQGGGMNQISQLMKSQPGEGLKKTGAIIAGICRKLLEVLLPLYGSESEEGAAVLKAIGALSKMTKGVETGDMNSILQSLMASLPPGMKGGAGGDMANMIAQIKSGASAQGGGAAPQPPPQPGAQPPMGGM